jgi:hypothetical protein
MKKDPLAPWNNAWFVTINTNSADRRLIKPLREIWSYILENIRYFMSFREGGGLIVVKERSVIEIGKKFKRIHLHSRLVVKSFGLANLDYGYIRSIINNYLQPLMKNANIYFNAKLIKNYNYAELIKEYLDKDPVNEEKE